MEDSTPTVAELRTSFSYGSRSNLNFKFVRDLTDDEFGDFIEELFVGAAPTADSGDVAGVAEVAYRWQVHAYSAHLGDPENFAHRHEDTPQATMTKPVAESRLALVTSSGHFVEGDDPEPFGEKEHDPGTGRGTYRRVRSRDPRVVGDSG